MREILFRGKRVDNGKWVYGYYFKATHHWHDNGIHEDWIATDSIQNGGWCNVRGKYAVIPETVGQYTGLTENGKKIFEGDILNGLLRLHPDRRIFQVIYEDNGFYFLDEDGVGWHPDHIADYEVIGNIHDNPELLKGDAK